MLIRMKEKCNQREDNLSSRLRGGVLQVHEQFHRGSLRDLAAEAKSLPLKVCALTERLTSGSDRACRSEGVHCLGSPFSTVACPLAMRESHQSY